MVISSEGLLEDVGCSNAAETEFVATLAERAVTWSSFGIDKESIHAPDGFPGVLLGIDVSDRAPRVVLRTLRVEFDGSRAMVGDDETMQLVTPLVAGSPGVKIFDGAPRACALAVAGWLEAQFRGAIHRREWLRDDLHYLLWVHADTGVSLIEMADLGSKDDVDLAAPDVVTVVRDYGSAG